MISVAEWKNAMHDASSTGDLDALRALLADIPAGATVDSDLGFGRSALSLASGGGQVEACAILLQAGASLDSRAHFGESPRCFAYEVGGTPETVKREAARLFAAYDGADPRPAPVKQEVLYCADGRVGLGGSEARTRAAETLRRLLGFDILWYGGSATGTVWVTAGELPALRAAVEDASSFSVRFRLAASEILPEADPEIDWARPFRPSPPLAAGTPAF